MISSRSIKLDQHSCWLNPTKSQLFFIPQFQGRGQPCLWIQNAKFHAHAQPSNCCVGACWWRMHKWVLPNKACTFAMTINLIILLLCGIQKIITFPTMIILIAYHQRNISSRNLGHWNIPKEEKKTSTTDLSLRRSQRLGMSCTICSNSLCASALGSDSFVKIWPWRLLVWHEEKTRPY